MLESKLESRRLVADDLSLQPEAFDNDNDLNPSMCVHWLWATLFPKNSNTPHFYFRSMMLNNFRKNGGIIKTGEGPLGQHAPAHHKDIAQGDTLMIPYHQVSEDPVVYETGSDEPYSRMTFTEDGIALVESDVLKVNIDFFPQCFITHSGTTNGDTCYYVQFGKMQGTYQGEDITALCVFDRMFTNADVKKAVTQPLSYIKSYHAGIRPDGKRECFYGSIKKANGIGEGFYWLEGEEPVMTTKVTLDAEWYKLPYVPEGDNTVVYKKSVWKLDDKVVLHCDCGYGSKGWLPEPRLEVKGLSQTFGDFYVGDIPYEHTCWHTLNECTGATVERVRELGFVVHE